MMPHLNRSFLLLVLLSLAWAAAVPVWGQRADSLSTAADTLGSVAGRVTDDDGEPMQMLTIRLLAAPDSTLRGGTVTDTLGNFRIDRVPLGQYILHYSFISFKTGYVNILLTPQRPHIRLSDIVLQTAGHTLSEAVVVGRPPMVTVIDDTVAYNAAAIDIPEGSMVETLIENIPGAEITDDGRIKINGKVYNRILVDGREFMGGDPQAALANLPANIIKRIKTYDRRSARARLTGVEDGEEDNVIDLEVKPNMFRGMVGQFAGAMGSHDRYTSSFNANRFRKDGHLSLLGGMNNINNAPFAERGRGAMNFSNAARPGLTAAKGFGLSFAREKRQVYKLTGNARYSYSNAEEQSSRHSETIYNDTNRTYRDNQNHSIRRRHEFTAGFELEWRPDTLTTLHLRPSVSHNSTKNWSGGHSFNRRWQTATSPDTVSISEQQNRNTSGSDDTSVSANLGLYRRLNRKGRNTSLEGHYSYCSGNSESFSRQVSDYFLQPSRNRNYNRYQDGGSFNLSTGFGLSYTEPLFTGMTLQLRYNFDYSHARSNRYGREVNHNAADSLLYRPDEPIVWATVPVATALSSCTENTHLTHTFNINAGYNTAKMNVNVGGRFTPRRNEVNYVFGPKMDKGLITQDLFNWSPNLQLRYRFNKRTNLSANYSGRSNEPNIDNLQEVIDKTNPQNVRYGNPNLRPSYSNSMGMSFRHASEKHRSSIVTNAGYSAENHSTSNMTLYENATGVRVSKLMEVDGRWGANWDASFELPLDSAGHWNLSTNGSVEYNESTNYNSTPLTNQDLLNAGVTVDFEEISPDDVNRLQSLALKNRTQTQRLRYNLGLHYHIKTFNIRLNGGVNYYRVHNSIQAGNRETFDYYARASVNAELPMNCQVSTSLNFTSRQGYAANIQKNIAIWNAQFTKRLFKRNAGLLTFQIFDILHQRSTVNRNISNLTITDTRSEALRDYFMVGFQWRFNTMGNQKGGQKGSQQGGRSQGGNPRPGQRR